MKKNIFILLFLIVTALSFGKDMSSTALYSCGVYGQSFELIEYSNGDERSLLLYMADNKTSITKTYDLDLPTVYFIRSKWVSNSIEYSKMIDATENFFEHGMLLIYLSDMKDICDIAPCCKSVYYGVKESQSKEKYIHIEYECSDLELLFEIAFEYNHRGRAYVLKNIDNWNMRNNTY